MVEFLKLFVDQKKGIAASEVKVAVGSFQKTLPVMFPFFSFKSNTNNKLK